MDMQVFLKKTLEWPLLSGLHIALVAALTLVALKVAGKLSARLVKFVLSRKEDGEFQKRAQTLGAVVRYVLVLVIFAVGVMTVLREYGIDIGPVSVWPSVSVPRAL